MASQLAWGILSTGRIAKTFAKGLKGSQTGRLVAVGSRSQASADAFADEFDIPNRHGSYDALLADDEVEAVYIATPHPMHPEWVIKAAEAGKHILCEKPIALNHAHAMAAVEAARTHGVALMEAFMYRCHPQTAKVIELVRDGAIGEVKFIEAVFGFAGSADPEGRHLKNSLGGGAILDVGCYPVSLARLIAGAAQNKPFANPTQVCGAGHVGQTDVDEYAAATLYFEGGIVAQVATGVRLAIGQHARILGSEGEIDIASPWLPAREGGAVSFTLKKKGEKQPQTIEVQSDVPLYGLEADRLARTLPNQQADSPAMSWDDTLGNMRTLDQWRQAVGVEYEQETPKGFPLPIHGRPLKANGQGKMHYAAIAGIDLAASRLVMGCDNQSTYAHAAVMFDDYFEHGGNAFDTAYIYGGGTMERLLGQWIAARGVRDQVVIIGKGAHTPHCNPEAMTKQLLESLDRLGVECIDAYLLHRDNLDVPIDEWVDLLNEHKDAGRIRAFGGSNWTTPRIDQANAYAKKHGKAGFSIVSNNFSLARMVEPVWPGCIAASDPESRRWLEQQQMPLLSWSSQAHGFFTDRSGPSKLDDPQLVQSWYSEDNFKRKRRAVELAEKKGVEPVNIAGAYVLGQPFPTFSLIGPRTLRELHSSLHNLDVELTADEMKWLNLES